MNKLGWGILIGILIVVGAFLSMTRFGGSPAPGGPVGETVEPVLRDSGLVRTDLKGYPLLEVPVAGVTRDQITDSWEDPREGGARMHHGTDIMAPANTPVLAAAPGIVEKLFHSDAGGITLYIRSPHRRWQYYYAHLAGYAPGIKERLAVKTGDLLGYVGDTGNAGAGNYHLHFGLERMRPGENWWQGEEVNPYPLLARSAAHG